MQKINGWLFQIFAVRLSEDISIPCSRGISRRRRVKTALSIVLGRIFAGPTANWQQKAVKKMFDFTKAQQEAIETLDRNVSVSAGAGSGKTRVLVERFVNILRQSLRQGGKQVSAADILAITFTRKAEGEMKERVRRRLAELEQEDALHASFWQQQLELLEQARINTIHGFCNSLLKENPVEAGLDPAFQVAEEVEMDEFLLRTVQQFVKQGLRRGDSDILRLAD